MTTETIAKKYNIYPVDDKVSFDYYRKQSLQMWDAEEIRIGEDKQEFLSLNPRMQLLVADVMIFLGPGDGLISSQIIGLVNRTKVFGQQAFLAYQMAIEISHAHAYADVIQMFFSPQRAKEIFESVDTLECVKAKADFITEFMGDITNADLSVVNLTKTMIEIAVRMEKHHRDLVASDTANGVVSGIKPPSLTVADITNYMNKVTLSGITIDNILDPIPLGQKYVAAAISEGIFFISQFCIIYYIRDRGILKRFCYLNEQVSKDEKVHRDNNIDMARKFRGIHFDAEFVRNIGVRALEIEGGCTRYNLRIPIDSREIDDLAGMTVENIDRYAATLMDQIVVMLGYPRVFTQQLPEPVDSTEFKEKMKKLDDKGLSTTEYHLAVQNLVAEQKVTSEMAPLPKGQYYEIALPWMRDCSLGKKTNFHEGDPGDYQKGSTKQAAVSALGLDGFKDALKFDL